MQFNIKLNTIMADNFEHLLNGATHSAPNPMSEEERIQHETYTAEELRDVNKITVTIPDTETPIVVFFGSQASGKTLALLRMIRFLEGHSYSVVPEEIFRPQTDKHYVKMCSGLKDMAYSGYAPGGTDIISFMLVKVLDQVGNPVCQILEAPGEHYFNPEKKDSANLSFPTYINAIRTAPNRKVWVFFVEQGWGADQGERNRYAQKICSMQSLISPKDKVVFLFNKADLKRATQYKPNGEPNVEVFFNAIKNQYPGIFEKYQNKGLAKMLFGAYNFKAICFSSGVFNDTADGREVWTLENDSYCVNLWNALTR